ncbi:hypothetical protein AB205_0046030, partial [Aquarana catesbeiana]
DLLEGLLDLDSSVTTSMDFLQFVSGSKTIPGFVPLAHRYGGHQVWREVGTAIKGIRENTIFQGW